MNRGAKLILFGILGFVIITLLVCVIFDQIIRRKHAGKLTAEEKIAFEKWKNEPVPVTIEDVIQDSIVYVDTRATEKMLLEYKPRKKRLRVFCEKLAKRWARYGDLRKDPEWTALTEEARNYADYREAARVTLLSRKCLITFQKKFPG